MPTSSQCQSYLLSFSSKRSYVGFIYNYDHLFPETVFQFLEVKAKTVSSSSCYLMPSLMTATSFLLRNTDTHFPNGNHIQPLKLYTTYVGHPRAGKSPAIETVLATLWDIDTFSKKTHVSTTTSSRVVKTISKQGKAFVASPELFDIKWTNFSKMTKTMPLVTYSCYANYGVENPPPTISWQRLHKKMIPTPRSSF